MNLATPFETKLLDAGQPASAGRPRGIAHARELFQQLKSLMRYGAIEACGSLSVSSTPIADTKECA